MTLTLRDRLIPDVEFHAHPKKDGTLSLKNDYSFQVDYSGDNIRCKATLRQTSVSRDTPEDFSITIEMIGFFECDDLSTDEDKRQAHVMAYNLLFPHLQAFIRELTVQAGLPPLMISPSPPEAENIKLAPIL